MRTGILGTAAVLLLLRKPQDPTPAKQVAEDFVAGAASTMCLLRPERGPSVCWLAALARPRLKERLTLRDSPKSRIQKAVAAAPYP